MIAKKSLGQHFLTSESALRTIIESAKLEKGEQVFEIGPGKGILTEALLLAGTKVLAIEKDRELIPFLQGKFGKEIKSGQLELIEGDVLEFMTLAMGTLAKNWPRVPLGQGYKIVANIPYYITGAIIEGALEGENPPKMMVLLVQKEVAQRIVARDGKESILSQSVKFFGDPKLIKVVPAGAFTPPPSVDSAILSISDIKPIEKIRSQKLFSILKKGFAHKRKLLKSNLETTSEALIKCNIIETARAEELSTQNWHCLADIL